MGEFINWQTLGTYGGCLAGVMALTQYTKELPIVKKFPTQVWSYILALFILSTAMLFTTETLTISVVFETILNAGIVSLAANGGYSGLHKLNTTISPEQSSSSQG